jgi:hypothetical protein
LIPVLALVIISCGKKEKKYEVTVPTQTEDTTSEISDIEFTKTPSDATTKTKEVVYAEPGEVITPDIYYKGVEFVVYDNAVRYNDTTIGDLVIKKLYEDLTESDKEKIGSLALMVLHKPHEIRIPSESEMEEYLDTKVFRIWIDNEEVPNSKLKDYKISDFKSYSGRMFVHKTGRKTHPQAFNVSFYTPNYYESNNMGKQQKYYGGEQVVSHRNVKRVRKNYADRNNSDAKGNAQASKKQNSSNEKQATSNYRIITTDELNKERDPESKMSSYEKVDNEPESEDFVTRRLMLMSSLKQNKKLNYELNGKTSTVAAIHEYLVNNETADVAFIEGTENTLKFSDLGKTKMDMTALQEVYTAIFKYKPKEKPGLTYVVLSEKEWKVITIDATVAKGSFNRNDSNYTYDASDLKNIKVFNEKGNQLSSQEQEDLQLGFSPVWVDGEKKLKELLSDPKIIQGFKNNEVVLFHSRTNTKNYDEALKVDAKKMFLKISNRDDGIWIHLYPHSYATTNPSFHQFKEAVKK